MSRPRFDPRVGKILWGRAWQSTPVFLPGESMDRGVWHRVAESDTTEATDHAHTLLHGEVGESTWAPSACPLSQMPALPFCPRAWREGGWPGAGALGPHLSPCAAEKVTFTGKSCGQTRHISCPRALAAASVLGCKILWNPEAALLGF